MKRIWKITAVAVVVAVVVIAAVLVMGQKNDVNWHNGDYVEYTWSSGAVNSTVAEPYAIQTYTVTNVGSNAFGL